MSDMKLQMILPKKYFVILYSENLFVICNSKSKLCITPMYHIIHYYTIICLANDLSVLHCMVAVVTIVFRRSNLSLNYISMYYFHI